MRVKLASDATVERGIDSNGLDSTEVSGLDVCLIQNFLIVASRTSRDRVRVY